MADPILIARRGDTQCLLLPGLANRHGLITGATGTGKTVTLQKMAESFSAIGVPVFMADVKGDLTGISQPGGATGKLAATLQERGLPLPEPTACPVTLWDVFGQQGHPVRATISDMGPLLLARMLDLNETQAGVLNLVFKIADDNGLLLLDLKDLRAMLAYVGDNAKQFTTQYGNVSAASIGAIQRGLLQLETQGADQFFGEPMLDVADMMQTVQSKGVINILAADKLLTAPRLYATFLLWLLSDLFERLPEVGDLEKPKFVFFFDEAHLLFADAPKALLERIELVVRLVRSKGVGVYFATQNPIDVPDTVLAQLGNRVQHALRAKDIRPIRSLGYIFAAAAGPVYYWLDSRFIIALCFGCLLLTNMVFLLKRNEDPQRERTFQDLMASTFILVYPTLPFFVVIPLLKIGGALSVTLLCLAFSLGFLSDTFGYIVGRPFGRHKLAPLISPSKSVEGAVAGWVAASAGAVVIGIIASTQGVHLPLYVYAAIGLTASAAEQGGDLFASAIKRYCGIKDFGNFFPGHGGVIDRLDGVFFSGVVVYVFSLFLPNV